MFVDVSAGSAQLGNSGLQGSLILSDGSSSTVTLKSAPQVAATNYDISIPAITSSDEVCLVTLANCAGGGGGSSTLQASYTSDVDGGDAIIALTSADGGILIRDASSPLTTAFAVQNNGGTANLLGVSSSAITMQDNSGNNALLFDSTNSELRVYENVASPTRYLRMYYDTANNAAVYTASSGATQIGSGTGAGGDINFTLNGAQTDKLTGTKAFTLTSSYAGTDFNYVRNLAGSTYALTGTVFKIEDLSSITSGSSAPTVLYVNQNNTSATGNLINAQTGGATDVFKVSTAGVVTIKTGGTLTGAGALTVSSGGATNLNVDTGGAATLNLGGTNATAIVVGGNTAATLTQKVANSSTTAFVLQTAGATNLLVADTTNSRLTIGTSDTTGTLLILDTKTGSGDPTGVNGAMYYNSNAGKFRCYQNSAWTDCLSPWITIRKTADQDITNSTTLTDDNTLQFAVAAGTTYVVKFNICYTGTSAAADYKGTFTFPAAIAAKNVSGRYISTTTADAIQTSGGVLGVTTAFPTAAGLGLGTAAATTDKRVFEGNFSYQANAAGTLRYQFAQNTLTAAQSARTCANSFIEYQAL